MQQNQGMASNSNKNKASSKYWRIVVKILILALIVFVFLSAAKLHNIQQLSQDTLAWIENAGPKGPIFFFILYVIATVFLLPGTILTLGAGAVFGVVKGSILVSISSTAGATAAFAAGRYLARKKVEQRIETNATFQAMDKAVGKEGWKIVGLTRLSPVFPFNVLNYAFSLTRISLRDYVLASWVGMIPGTILYVYIGSLAGSLAELGIHRNEEVRSAAGWAVSIVGLIATAAVTVIVTRIARRALRQRLNPATEQEMKQP